MSIKSHFPTSFQEGDHSGAVPGTYQQPRRNLACALLKAQHTILTSDAVLVRAGAVLLCVLKQSLIQSKAASFYHAIHKLSLSTALLFSFHRPAGPKPDLDGCWAEYWYAGTHRSTGEERGTGSLLRMHRLVCRRGTTCYACEIG